VIVVTEFALVAFPTSSQPTVTLKVGYPEEIDESDVTDLFAFQLLAKEGIQVTYTTYYENPSLAYKGLLASDQDIILDETMGSLVSGQDTTCVGSYQLGGVFLAVAGDNITSPSQMLGKTAADFGPGSIMRDLNDYWFTQAGIAVNTVGTNPSSVYEEAAPGDVQTLHDLLTGQAQEIVADDFILSDLQSPTVNSSAFNGPFHVLFYAPANIYSSCYAVRDSWLASPSNQVLLEKFLGALYQAQRYFILHPTRFVNYALDQLPESPEAEIQFASTFYPAHLAFWPYGVYNLQGNESLQIKYNNTNQFFIDAGILKSPVANGTVQPYGVFNKYFELKALQMIGPYTYPQEIWVNDTFTSNLQHWVPAWMDGS
jgi:ABC-type nitrate/sulfonate/bicarbonate transport system substrate-binding protein